MQKDLLNPAKDHMVKNITETFQDQIARPVTDLIELFKNTDSEISILSINCFIRKIEHAATKIGHELRPYVNIEASEIQREVYLKHIYKQFEDLYENYCTDDNKLNWEQIKIDKGEKFIRHFPLQDAIKAAKMVASGELEI